MSEPQNITFDSWIAEQSEDIQSLVNGHIGGLKSALSSEREGKKALDSQLKEAIKKAEKGSGARQQLESLQAELTTANARTTFYEAAQQNGVSDFGLAFIAAQSGGMLNDDGSADWDALKGRHAALFASPPAPRGNAGTGTGTPPTSKTGMDSLIRSVAGY